MSPPQSATCQPPISLLELLTQHGWKPVRDQGRDEVAGLCPLHRDRHPSFYVNRRKQVFYCHGCGRGGGMAQLRQLLDHLPPTIPDFFTPVPFLDPAYSFYQRQLLHFDPAQAYLARRGIKDGAVLGGNAHRLRAWSLCTPLFGATGLLSPSSAGRRPHR